MDSFQGIPYALPPVGDLRWQKPVASPGPGEGNVFPAVNIGLACPQGGVAADFGLISEDCLTLSVWRRSDTTSK